MIVAESRAGNDGNEEVPPANQANQAINVAISGNKARVTTTSAQASKGSAASVGTAQPAEKPFWTRSRRVGAFVVGAATIAGAIAAILALMH
jgi:hypothetical protein